MKVTPPTTYLNNPLDVTPPNLAGAGAFYQAAYVTIGNDATLTKERALTAGSGITITDGGANSTVTIASTGASGGSYYFAITFGN